MIIIKTCGYIPYRLYVTFTPHAVTWEIIYNKRDGVRPFRYGTLPILRIRKNHDNSKRK